MLQVGTKLSGRYEVLSPLGSGGMGEVYGAKDLRLGRDVAIKVLPEHLAADRPALTRFEREAKALALLSHPNILTIYDFGADSDFSFAVMELLKGETLRSNLSRSKLVTKKALEIGIAIAEGLAAAHSQGIMHRDLKPENVFLTSDGGVKILDFGLARMKEVVLSSDLTSAPTESEVTKIGTVMGTVPYMSPEQVRGMLMDIRSDLFSFGALLYEMVSGARAFSGNSSADIAASILKEDPPGLTTLDEGLPPAFSDVISRCLQKKPEDRFQSAQDLVFALKMISGGLNRTSAAASAAVARPALRVRSVIWIVVFPISLTLAVFAYLFTRRNVGPAEYVRLTNFTDSVTSPSLSPDGRMLTFIRGENTFIGPGEIYAKLLPDGEPVQLTHDGSLKMGPVFSPDGARTRC